MSIAFVRPILARESKRHLGASSNLTLQLQGRDRNLVLQRPTVNPHHHYWEAPDMNYTFKELKQGKIFFIKKTTSDM